MGHNLAKIAVCNVFLTKTFENILLLLINIVFFVNTITKNAPYLRKGVKNE